MSTESEAVLEALRKRDAAIRDEGKRPPARLEMMEMTVDEKKTCPHEIDCNISALEGLVAKGNANAKLMLARLYFCGLVGKKDQEKAESLLKSIPGDGSAVALCAQGMRYQYGTAETKRDEKQAFSSFTEAEQKGSEIAYSYLGIAYLDGIVCMRNEAKGTACLEELANKGSAIALDDLGFYCYLTGQLPKSFDYYKRAYKAGCMSSVKNLGGFYERGIDGVLIQDKRKAQECYEALVKCEVTAGLTALAGFYLEQGEYAKAVGFFTRAHETGDFSATAYFGYCYLSGFGVVQDNKKGIDLLEEAYARGSAVAMHYLGQCYFHGLNGVQTDRPKALALLEDSANRGSSSSMLFLAKYYLNAGNHNNGETWPKAQEYLTMVIKRGFQVKDAQTTLSVLKNNMHILQTRQKQEMKAMQEDAGDREVSHRKNGVKF